MIVPGTSYVFTDMLGSVRAITSSAGAPKKESFVRAPCATSKPMPFYEIP